jgi:adenine-specific DNA-methyltransferase
MEGIVGESNMIKQRLELDWIGKDDVAKLEPRILIEDKQVSTSEKKSRNKLIHGDNLLALKALESDYTEQIKCVLIDPPYNTGAAFAQYDDGIEHSLWLSLMRDRLIILKKLLRQDGSLWITIDDNEVHYLKVLCDEIFGRTNFVSNIVWQSKDTPGNNSSGIAQTHNHVLVYRKSEQFKPNLLQRNEEQLANYSNPDDDPRGPWLATPLTRAEHRDRDYYPLKNPKGKEVLPPAGSSWRRPPDKMKELEKHGRIWWGVKGDAQFPSEKKFLTEVKEGVVNQTWWPYEFAGSTRNASAEMKTIYEGKKAFDTPKPEKLIFRILNMATSEGDIVLDSFAGSGTTGAVAHKMNRSWIMIELGDHCETLIIPRINKVIQGDDNTPLSKELEWKGGGGFQYYKLAPSLLQKDSHGNWIISPKYDAIQLAEAVSKHEGFKFWPDQNVYWKQGKSTEKDFIFVTTEFLTADRIERIAASMKPDETLLICAKAFRVPASKYPNITIKKIPQMLLGRCEFGRDDYSLNVKEPVQEEMGLDESDI